VPSIAKNKLLAVCYIMFSSIADNAEYRLVVTYFLHAASATDLIIPKEAAG